MMRRLRYALPLGLTALRAVLGPVVLYLAWYRPEAALFAICLVSALLSDIFDGMIARRLGVATAGLRRLDSVADSIFYVAATLAAWHLHPAILSNHLCSLAILAALELLRYAVDFYKFKREASYHLWSSKLWGLALFGGFMSLLAWQQDGVWVLLAIWMGILADLEGLAISLILTHWQHDVPTLWHALGIAAGHRQRA
jgi:CDP-diacylglycerol--glycerol-3-phosphate 3-phosphatidyltransferase